MTSQPSDTGAVEDRPAAAPLGSTPTEPLPPYGASGAHAVPGPDGPAGPGTPPDRPAGFFVWVRSLGIVRGSDRWLGGVASGIAARTGLDPVLVRGILIIMGLFGVGALLYGLAWAFLPEPDGRIHAEEAVRGSWSAGTTGAMTACILGLGSPGIFWADGGFLGGLFWTLFWLAGAGLLVYWLTTRGSGPDAVKGDAAKEPANWDVSHRDADDWDAAKAGAGQVPPSSTPTGSQVALVLGAVLLGLGTVLTLDYADFIQLESPVAAALAAAAVVNGLGIVVLGAVGRSSGVLGLTAVLALVGSGLASTNIGPYANFVVAGQADWTPDRSNPATEGYSLAAADGHLDLRYLTDASSPGAEVSVSVAASDLTILVPDDIPVLIRSEMLAGNMEIDDGVAPTESGSMWRSAERRLNDTGGEPVVVHIKGVASNVLVTVNESDLDR